MEQVHLNDINYDFYFNKFNGSMAIIIETKLDQKKKTVKLIKTTEYL